MSLAILAGSGALPRAVAEAQAQASLIVALPGAALDGLRADRALTLETLSRDLATLRGDGITTLCLAGGVSRPTLDPSKVEPDTAPLIGRIAAALGQGDDAALRVLMDILTEAGFTLLPAHEAAPELCPPEGVLSTREPSAQDQAALTKGRAVLDALSPQDIGQAVCVRGGHVLAVEALFGTAWMLDSLSRRPAEAGPGGLLVKVPKRGQDLRADMPAIGPDTITQAAKAGLDGIAIEAGRVLCLDRDTCIARAEAAGLLLWVFGPGA
ncbi:MAG: LpxI family protein [Shimia sp.]